MSASVTGSMILAFALKTGVPCPEAFSSAVAVNKLTNPSSFEMNDFLVRDDASFLLIERFAQAACQTTNPDIIWQIAAQESSHRFLIVRINADNKVLIGQEAVSYLKALQKIIGRKLATGRIAPSDLPNIDIGTMQINLRYHGEHFGFDLIKMLDPAMQVAYLATSLGEGLYKRCKKDWIGCYHNTNEERRSGYIEKLNEAGEKLESALFYLSNSLASLDDSTKSPDSLKITYCKISQKEVPSIKSESGLALNQQRKLYSFYSTTVVWPEHIEEEQKEEERKADRKVELTKGIDVKSKLSFSTLIAEL